MRVALGLLVIVLGAALKVVGTSRGHTSTLGTAGVVVMVIGVIGAMIALMQSGPRGRRGVPTPGHADAGHSGLTADLIDPNL